MMIDLRSDTVTKPTSQMLEAMLSARVGDDVFEEDPTVIELEKKCAQLFKMEAAIFCPSGTMTNQIGIHILSNPYEEVICYKGSHIYKYEGGGVAGTSGLSFKLLEGHRGIIDKADVLASINPDDIHFPVSSILALENTVNKGGGKCYTLPQIAELSNLARKHQLNLHLDGARIFNALAFTGDQAHDYGQYFDTISICMSKGLGAPVGSLLLGSHALIKKARRVRKFMGGGMRQAGYLAAACIYALDNHVDRLVEDHKRAKVLEEELMKLSYINEVLPVETNIVIFKISDRFTNDEFLELLKSKGILAVPFGPNEIRLVTHLDYNDDMLAKSIEIFRSIQ